MMLEQSSKAKKGVFLYINFKDYSNLGDSINRRILDRSFPHEYNVDRLFVSSVSLLSEPSL